MLDRVPKITICVIFVLSKESVHFRLLKFHVHDYAYTIYVCVLLQPIPALHLRLSE